MCLVHGAGLSTSDVPAEQTVFTVVQVFFDIASSIGNAAKKDVAHRDVTPNNFGQWKGRGHLYDFSAGKVSSTSAGSQ